MFFRTHRYLDGSEITFDEANYIFRERIRQVKYKWSSPLSWIKEPIAWVRWAGVEAFGRGQW